MAEQRGRDAPCTLTCALLLVHRNVLVTNASGLLGVNYLVEAGEDVAACDVLEHDSSLHEEAAGWDLARHFFPITSPKEQPWVAGLAMHGNKVKIVVEAGKGRADLILHQIASSRSQEVGSLPHAVGEGGLGQAHAYSGHLCSSDSGVDHVIAPRIHLLLPVGEVVRDHLWQIVADGCGPLADGPEEAPLGVEVLRVHSQRLVSLRQLICQRLVVSRLLHGLRSDTCLIAQLGSHVS